ncbi:Gfo/Idh/MocA family protein [Spirosoma utsteinense]|uniref:Dehydrogenase n=1 Tax=Spirosoma utsteinense TaxID=2585773 RepID=A0ABR6W9T1_9BACT|nr:Gfo/Idh/MocA family oxidoreductase [Spirosoma utsteinense]MBC3787681.1 putative dehydrogenase [Spirosoma utsteinense]MBC3792716.1 putative dehydrogenase [Spirosoma utsteinense]
MLRSSASSNRRLFLKQAAGLAVFSIVPRHVLGRGFLAPSDQIAVGFIGLGKQSGGLRKQFLQNNARVMAACDVDTRKVTAFSAAVNEHYASQANASSYKGCLLYDDYRKLLDNKSIDAVVIATPDHWHSVIAIQAAKAGKDIYCEKPLALTITEGRDMVKATRRYKRIFQTGSMQRSWPEFRQAVELVRNGFIGEVKTVNVNVGGPPRPWDLEAQTLPAGLNWDAWLGPNTVTRPYNNVLLPTPVDKFWGQWRDIDEFGGGGMTDWGAHMFDIAQWGLGMDESGPVDLTVPTDGSGKGLVYRYANGVVMNHLPVEGKQFCEFIGSEGEVKVARGELTTTPVGLKDRSIGESERKVYFSDNHYKDFLDAIRSRKNPICDVEVGHRTASVCTIGNIAYRLKRPLRWNPATEKFQNDPEANQLLSRPMRKEWSV